MTRDSRTSTCQCGCGEPVTRSFLPGPDARLKSLLLRVERGEMKPTDLPATLRSTYTWKRKGAGQIPTRDYAGRPHSGYDRG